MHINTNRQNSSRACYLVSMQLLLSGHIACCGAVNLDCSRLSGGNPRTKPKPGQYWLPDYYYVPPANVTLKRDELANLVFAFGILRGDYRDPGEVGGGRRRFQPGHGSEDLRSGGVYLAAC